MAINNQNPTPGTSYGIFYPFGDGQIINNPRPTIIGKVAQNKTAYMGVKFGIETSPISGQDDNFLRFVPGRTVDLRVKIDGVDTDTVYGIAQYPTILCNDKYDTRDTCYKSNFDKIPPLLFFTKPAWDLADGVHTISVEGKEKFPVMTFSVDREYRLPAQNIFINNKNSNDYFSTYKYFGSADSCYEGYYYDMNHLKIPLPAFDNKNIYYGISFPQNPQELGSINRRKVMIQLGSQKYDLFFPQSDVYFQGKSFRGDNPSDPMQELYLPKDHLIYSDGKKAEMQKADKMRSYWGGYTGGYLEIFPVDTSGGQYRNSILPWVISNSSGCDG